MPLPPTLRPLDCLSSLCTPIKTHFQHGSFFPRLETFNIMTGKSLGSRRSTYLTPLRGYNRIFYYNVGTSNYSAWSFRFSNSMDTVCTYFYLLSNDTVSNRSRTPIKKIFNKTTIQTPFLECFAIFKIVFLNFIIYSLCRS